MTNHCTFSSIKLESEVERSKPLLFHVKLISRNKNQDQEIHVLKLELHFINLT